MFAPTRSLALRPRPAVGADGLSGPRIVTEPLGGSALSKAAMDGTPPDGWYVQVPRSANEWERRLRDLRPEAGWLRALEGAFQRHGPAWDRLTKVVAAGGAVVTTGQQPGLFGGPVYSWTKALTARALADRLQAVTGVPTAAVFWAATDDSDFAEAASVTVPIPGGYRTLTMDGVDPKGRSLTAVPLGDLSMQLAELENACGSASDGRVLAMLRGAYRADATVGDAYVELLRQLLDPLEVAVADASHQAVRTAAHGVLVRALSRASAVNEHLVQRTDAIQRAGFKPQVAVMSDLTLVFQNIDNARTRISQVKAPDTARLASPGSLSPNVLLRPVVERVLFPTAAYVAGPGEIAYFAQVTAVAEALGVPVPLAVPRWSATIIEPHVERLLDKYDLRHTDLSDVDQVAKQLTARALPEDALRALERLRDAVLDECEALRRVMANHERLAPAGSVDAIERTLRWRLERFERRLRAGIRRTDLALSSDLGTLGGALYPGGKRQERSATIIPFLAKHGVGLLETMLEAARRHVQRLVPDRAGP